MDNHKGGRVGKKAKKDSPECYSQKRIRFYETLLDKSKGKSLCSTALQNKKG